MFRITLLLVVLTAIAQAFPSCGGGGDGEGAGVVGWVEMKKVEPGTHAFIVVINSTDYEVPGYFWQQVEVGDLVKWDGRTWTIVKRENPQKPLPNPG
jgi:hypothetical protein